MIDCLIIGYNERDFADYVATVRSTGTDHAAFRDLNRGFLEWQGAPYRCQDILNHFYWQDRPEPHPRFHSFDFLAPAITYLGTYLTRRGFSFDYVNHFHLEQESLAEKLRTRRYRTIAITTTFYVTPDPIVDIVSFIRRHSPDARIVVGGPHIAYTQKLADASTLQYLFRYMGADFYVISSEGECALVGLLAALRDGRDLDAVDNLAYRRGEGFVLTASSTESNPLAENRVDYDLFPPAELGEFVSLRTAKSCPFNCSFCDFPQFAGKYKYMAVEEVEAELDALRALGTVTTLTFLDDTFNVPKKRFKELLRMMIRNRYGFRWNCFYRADHGDPEVIDLMAEAGCEGVFMGIESASDRMLKMMNKHARRADYARAIPHLREVGIIAYASLIVGFPGETEETVAETIDFLEEYRPDYYLANIWYGHPVTPIYQRREELDIRGSAYSWSHSTMDSSTAADHAERMFFAVEGSTWLPCDLWSVFYLQRKGMTRAQISEYVRCFNAVVKDKLVAPGRGAPHPALFGSLRRACQFDRPGAPDLTPVAELSGSAYRAAEEFWLGELADGRPTASLERLGGGEEGAAAEAWQRLAVRVEGPALAALGEACGAEPPALLLGAFAALLAAEAESPGVAVLASTAAGELLPLRLFAAGPGLRPWVAAAGDLARARAHGRFGLYVTTHRGLLARRGLEPPRFEVGFEVGSQAPAEGVPPGLAAASPAAGSLALTLEATAADGGVSLALCFRPRVVAPPTARALAGALAGLLRTAAADPDAPVAGVSVPALAGAPARPQPDGAGPLITLSDRAAQQRRAMRQRFRRVMPS